MANAPRNNHYVPQFFLRNFAVDAKRRKVRTIAKDGDFATWAVRSIERLGYERDFYMHERNGVPVSVETAINRGVENPLSASDTWRKIVEGREVELDCSDRAVIYSLIRHLHARTPHALASFRDLGGLAASPNSTIAFSDEERALYAQLRSEPARFQAFFTRMAASLDWAEDDFAGCWMRILRSPLRLRSSTTPVFSIPAPNHPALRLGLPGMVPYAFALTLNPFTLALLAIGDFDGDFANIAISEQEARGFNRYLLGQFAFFPAIRHLIAERDDLIEDMTWAPYDTLADEERRIVFRRRTGPSYADVLQKARGD